LIIVKLDYSSSRIHPETVHPSKKRNVKIIRNLKQGEIKVRSQLEKYGLYYLYYQFAHQYDDKKLDLSIFRDLKLWVAKNRSKLPQS